MIERQADVRYYPQGDIGAVVLGQVGQITGPPLSHPELGTAPYKGIAAGTIVGQSGLEATYQRYLQGTAGRRAGPGRRRRLPDAGKSTTVQPVAGDELMTSLDLGLEQEGYIAADEARIRPAQRLPGAGGLVRRDRPEQRRRPRARLGPDLRRERLRDAADTTTYDAPAEGDALIDRAIAGAYPTGSTFKPITALAGSERRPDHAADTAGRRRLRELRHDADVLQLRRRRLRQPTSSTR